MGPTETPRVIYNAPRVGAQYHGGANGLVPLLPASQREPDKAIRIALGARHAEKFRMRKTLSGGFWIVSLQHHTDSLNLRYLALLSAPLA